MNFEMIKYIILICMFTFIKINKIYFIYLIFYVKIQDVVKAFFNFRLK